ncbi:hypothetical protein MD484_g8670, partial [Candolleomyces efflorescens]
MEAVIPVLPNARRVNIQESQFNIQQINGTTMIQAPQPVIDKALEILHGHRAIEACHTSKTAAEAPKCKPGTRGKAIGDLIDWAKECVNDPSSSGKSVLWLRGPAGSGKTCIMRVVARICHEHGVLVGDYFFSTRVAGLDNDTPFVATILFQLITVFPALGDPVQKIIRLNPKIFEQSLEWQLEELITKQIASIPFRSPRILVIDGFDECRDQTQRARLLRLLHTLVNPPHLFRVILASRPEYDIRTAFSQAPLKSITKIIHLEEYEVDGEIYQYLADEFARIRENHPAKGSIPADWPGQPTLRALTDKSSGIWAFPSTVIKYVDNPRRRPVELLKHVLDASSAAALSGRPFAELDTLYGIILDPPDCDIPLMKRLLHLVIEITRLSPALGTTWTRQILLPSHLDEFLSLPKGTTEITLCDLHSVVSLTEDSERSWIYFHHKSLEDYLCSPERSGELHQSQATTHSDILTVCIHNLELQNGRLLDLSSAFQIVDPVINYSYFDARIVWRCFAFTAQEPPEEFGFRTFVTRFHNNMCTGRAKCWRACASFTLMLVYLERLHHILDLDTPMARLKRFEEDCEGLFAPLDRPSLTLWQGLRDRFRHIRVSRRSGPKSKSSASAPDKESRGT